MSAMIHSLEWDRGFDFLLVVTIGIALVSSAAWLVSRRLAANAALRHLVLFFSLVACLMFPAIGSLFAAAGLTLGSIPHFNTDSGAVAPAATQSAPAYAVRAPQQLAQSISETDTPLPHNVNSDDASANSETVAPSDGVVRSGPPVQAKLEPARGPTTSHFSFRGLASWATWVWGVGVLLMLARLAWSCWRVVHLRRQSRPVQDEQLLSLLREVVVGRGLRVIPGLLQASRPIPPLATGFWRPAIILPECVLGKVKVEELRDVLIHEVAHLVRGDQWIVLLEGLAAALYWPVVSVHALNRELRRAREEICDNFVLACRDPIGYGQSLLQIAELLVNPRPLRAAVGILHWEGMLERRIRGLIDPRRDRRTTTTRKAAGTVMCALFLGTAMLATMQFAVEPAAAATQPDAERQGTVPGTQTDDSKSGSADSGQHKDDPERVIVIQGKVIDTAARPVARARLYLSVDERNDPFELGTSGADGTYRFEVPERVVGRKVTSGFPYNKCQAALLAVAEGLGAGWAELRDDAGGRYGRMKSEYIHDFHLAPDFPISGRVVDKEGKPIAGATVSVFGVYELSDPRWWRMHPAIKAGDASLLSREQADVNNWFTPLYPTAWQTIPPATTDAAGRFRIAGVGGDRAIRLTVSGPGVRNIQVSALTRDDVDDFTQKIRALYPRTRREPNGPFDPDRKEQTEGDPGVLLFGPSPTIEVDPARTISGTVRDASTGEPIAGMQITTADQYGSGRAITDRNGRYCILRAKHDPTILIYSDAYHAAPYLTVVHRLTDAQGLVDFEVPRGVAVDGRIVEEGTDRPIVSAPRQDCHDLVPGPLVAGYVTYFPLATNTALRGTPTGLYFEGFPTGSQSFSKTAVIDGDGRFQMAVPPGPGVLLVQARPGFPMFGEMLVHKEHDGLHHLFPYATLESRAQDDGGPGEDPQSFPGFLRKVPLFPLSNYHAYRVINPPANATSLDLKLTVRRGPTRVVRFVDPQGRPVQGSTVRGLVGAHPNMGVVLNGSEAEILALEPGKPRRLIVVSADESYTARSFVSLDDPQPTTIHLEPAGTIIGRIVDEDGKPIQALLSPPNVTGAGVGAIPQARSDAEGRFQIKPLFPGLLYSAVVRGGYADTEVVGTIFEHVVVEAGEVRDVGEFRVKTSVAAKPAS